MKQQPTYLTASLRLLAGLLIAGHGIYRIAILKQYTAYVSTEFDFLLPQGALSEALIVMFPFAEFFVGALIISNIAIREALNLGVFITLILMAFLMVSAPSPHLIYHLSTLAVIIWLKSLYRGVWFTSSELEKSN